MSPLRDVVDWVFSSFALLVACFAVFDTHRVVRWLSYGRKTELSVGQAWTLRVPGAVVVTGILWRMLITLLGKS